MIKQVTNAEIWDYRDPSLERKDSLGSDLVFEDSK